MSIREQIRLLARYQELDTQMHAVDQKLAEMPRKLTALESERERFEAEMVTKAAALEDLNKRYRGLEADLKQRQDSILKAQAKLSTVKTNKEYQAMLTEIEQIERSCSALEDHILAILEAMDTAASELETEKADLSQLKDRLSGEAAMIEREIAELQTHRQALVKEQGELARRIDTKRLDQLKSIQRQNANGVGIAEAEAAICQGCNMNIPPQMYNELQRMDDLRLCPHCHRLIYWRG
jgi:predicted  nucleic acid-binding Zn-ribbon protein